MKKSILLTFVLAATIGASLLTGCGKDDNSTIKTDNYIGTYYGYFTLEKLAFSNPALDTVIGKQLLDTLTITENGNTTDNIVTANSKVLNTTIDITLTAESAATLAITNKSVTIASVAATGVTASGTANYNTSTKFLTIKATATAGTVFSLQLLGLAKPELGGYFTKQ